MVVSMVVARCARLRRACDHRWCRRRWPAAPGSAALATTARLIERARNPSGRRPADNGGRRAEPARRAAA
ncbi:hypothetical protein EHH44_08060 [Mycolicibacter terrae]|uniref:Uncharacterized protein n=1 Tax=Mycolicibacter terrae TaxID=1788 RepID=A0ACD2EPJ4_9MYCO|nr:hypothetical protein EHH44_08060 [Mycolicibacter terrae]